MRCWLWLIALAALLLLTLPRPALADDDAEMSKLVHDYICAYARNDNPVLRMYLTTRDENLFGPFPFKGMPTLKKPTVDDNQALVSFEAKMPDANYPGKGGILFYRKHGTWLVRQVLFYDKVPVLFNLPKKSVTDKDRQNEPVVAGIADQFMKAWQKDDTTTLNKYFHRWMDDEPDIRKGMSVSKYESNRTVTDKGEIFIRYKAKLTYRWGLLSYTMDFNGGFILVKENGAYKLRGNVMVLYF